ncbi:hypothetical protein A9762_11535 [Pandoraea sp. ISTKB]|nr:hypothetical protein A9762_11535 [Pandoraea sp. ISTKB]
MNGKSETRDDTSENDPSALSAIAYVPGVYAAASKFVVAIVLLCVVVAYAFLSATYLGPILAALCGVCIMSFGAAFGARSRGEPGGTPAAFAVILAGATFVCIGGATALIHVLRLRGL